MSINLKQPKYVLPLVILPFLCLFFYVYHSSAVKNKKVVKQQAGINTNIGEVSADIKKKSLEDKLDAYRNEFKDADGNTAVNPITSENQAAPGYNNSYNDRQKKTLDSINLAMKQKFAQPSQPNMPESYSYHPQGTTDQDKALAAALNNLSGKHRQSTNSVQDEAPQVRQKDPMEIFKQQMAYMDSINKMNDPAYKAEKQKKDAAAKAAAQKASEVTFEVHKADDFSSDFNTILPQKNDGFIMAVVDENVTGYASSRIKLKLLEDIVAGKILIKKGTFVYALISGFSGQRVTLSIKSIVYDNKIIPVKLEIYDLDGLPGLYVPQSAFRDFTKDASTNVMQGVDVQSSSTAFVMSAADKLFESTSTAIADAIRKNKAKIKYNSYVYLIDSEALQKAQKSY